MVRTELPGDVVQWGADHKQTTAAACCAACKAQHAQGCNTWVYCGNASACGTRHRECWLKKRAAPFEDTDLLVGYSSLWTSGVLGEAPQPPSAASLAADAAAGAPCDFALLTVEGLVRLRLRKSQAPYAARYLSDLLDEQRKLTPPDHPMRVEAPSVDEKRPVRDGLRFYRAEPVPDRWGSPEWPDNYLGGVRRHHTRHRTRAHTVWQTDCAPPLTA